MSVIVIKYARMDLTQSLVDAAEITELRKEDQVLDFHPEVGVSTGFACLYSLAWF